MTNKTRLLGAAALGLLVAACGTNPQERTTGGAAAGAATGAGIGALGGPPGVLAGAAIGGGVGAVTGAVTSPNDVNLGRPVWNDSETRGPGMRGASGAGTVSQAQSALNSRGYNVGSVDGRVGPQTSRAVMDFQRSNNLSATGRLDGATLAALNVGTERSASYGAPSGRSSMGRDMQTSQMGTSPDRSGVATDADPGAGGTGGSGGSVAPRPGQNLGGSSPAPTMERSGTATGADPGAGGTGGSGGGVTAPRGAGVPAMPGGSGGNPLERGGRATDADPGTGGTGGSGGGASGVPRR